MERTVTDDAKHLGGAVYWSVDGRQIAHLSLNWDSAGQRCGHLDIPVVPSWEWQPVDVATLRA